MGKMSEEEIIKTIEKYVKQLKIMPEELLKSDEIIKFIDYKEIKAIQGLLDLYIKEKEKNKKLEKEIFELNKEMSDFADQWLHKDKIRKKIQELEQDMVCVEARNILKELLGE